MSVENKELVADDTTITGGTKEVWIHRVEEIVLPGYDPADRVLKIGSAFAGNGSRDVLRGLTREEEKKYLPPLLGIPATSEDWERATKDYWASISVSVPPEGRKLEVGMIGKEPINVEDYILYRYCLVYGRVANTKDDVKKSPQKIKFFLYSKEDEIKKDYNSLQEKRKAFAVAMELSADRKIVRHILWAEKEALGIVNPDSLQDKEQDIKFFDLVERNPKCLVKYKNDSLLKFKAFIMKALSLGFLTKVPNTETIMYTLDGSAITLGDTFIEAAAYFSKAEGESLYKNIVAKVNSSHTN